MLTFDVPDFVEHYSNSAGDTPVLLWEGVGWVYS